MFGDSSPDRWGRMLMKRRLERDIREGIKADGTQLYESDYLLGVHDLYRVGALRYRLEDEGEFLSTGMRSHARKDRFEGSDALDVTLTPPARSHA